jgi:hypothetical protein
VTTTRNYDYTVSVTDRLGNTLSFRDICGSDLEYFDHLYKYDPDSPPSEETVITHDQVMSILRRLLARPEGYDLGRLTHKTLSGVFTAVNNEILINYMPKVSWLKFCYGVQDGSFTNLKTMEEVPMSKFVVLVDIHRQALKDLNPGQSNDNGQ